MIGQAQTGSGKTAAFGLPMHASTSIPTDDEVQALVLTPTRELCIQVTQALRAYGRAARASTSSPSSAARPIRSQQAQLRAGGHVVVGTVGRVMDLMSRALADPARVPLRRPRRGRRDARPRLPRGRREDPLADARTAARRRSSARRCRRRSASSPTATSTTRCTIKVKSKNADRRHGRAVPRRGRRARTRRETLVEVLQAERPTQAIVFARTKIRCDQLYRTLRDKGLNVKALHGDMSQGSRDGVMLSFKGGRVPILVATDVAARGLDISTVTHVVNFDVPTSPDVYVHRIGRTGRVGRVGPRDHLRRAAPAARARGDRAAHRHHDQRPGRPARRSPRPRSRSAPRHAKPHIKRPADEPYTQLIVSVGRAAGLEVADIVHAVTHAAGVDGEAVQGRAGPRAVLPALGPAVRGRARDRAGQRRAGQRHGPPAGAGQGVTVLLCPPPAGMASWPR